MNAVPGVAIKETACRGCRLCVDECPTKVLGYDESRRSALVQDTRDCIACLSCTFICPSGAITISDFHVVKNFYRNICFSRKVERYL